MRQELLSTDKIGTVDEFWLVEDVHGVILVQETGVDNSRVRFSLDIGQRPLDVCDSITYIGAECQGHDSGLT